jgi:hypothetical protein
MVQFKWATGKPSTSICLGGAPLSTIQSANLALPTLKLA